MTCSLNGIAPLSHLGVIRVEGEDAAKFLHGQLTQDFALLGMDQARLAAFLSPKGRMLANFIGFQRGPAEVLLVCSRDLLAPTLKRLSMFVLRAKAKSWVSWPCRNLAASSPSTRITPRWDRGAMPFKG